MPLHRSEKHPQEGPDRSPQHGSAFCVGESWQLLSPRSVEGIDPRTGEGFVTRVGGEHLIPYCEERQRRALHERDHEAKDWVSCIPSFQSFARSFVLVARKCFLLSSLSRILRYHATCKCLIVAAWCQKTRVVGSFIEIRATPNFRNTSQNTETLSPHFSNTFETLSQHDPNFRNISKFFRNTFGLIERHGNNKKKRCVFDAEQVNLSPGATYLQNITLSTASSPNHTKTRNIKATQAQRRRSKERQTDPRTCKHISLIKKLFWVAKRRFSNNKGKHSVTEAGRKHSILIAVKQPRRNSRKPDLS